MRDYADAMRLLFAKTSYPVEGQATKLTSELNSKFRNKVQNLDHAVEIALYIEDLDIGSSPEKAMATAKGRSGQRLTDGFDKLALSPTEAVKYGRRDNNGDRGNQSGNSHRLGTRFLGRCSGSNQVRSVTPSSDGGWTIPL